MRTLDRRYAFLGWIAWTLAKRQLRRAPSERPPRRRRFLRAVTAVAVLAALAALWARRGDGHASRLDEPLA
jgi:hypothetical protein